MPNTGSNDQTRNRMRDDWDRRAREDASYYVAFGRRGQGREEVFATAVEVLRTLREEFRRTLYRNDLWAVAKLIWGDDNSAEVTAAASDAEGAVRTVKQLGYLPYPTGYTFSPNPF